MKKIAITIITALFGRYMERRRVAEGRPKKSHGRR